MRKFFGTNFHGSLSAAFYQSTKNSNMEKGFSGFEETKDLEKLYDDKLKEALVIASEYNQFVKEGKRSDIYEFEKEFNEKSNAFNESINVGVASQVRRFRKIHPEIKSIDDFPESKISEEEWAELYENENKRRKTELFYKKAHELMTSLGYEIVKSDEEEISLRKGDKTFELEYRVLPNDNTSDKFVVGRVGGFGRITSLSVTKGDERICFFKGRWVRACEDLKTQEDIYALVSALS